MSKGATSTAERRSEEALWELLLQAYGLRWLRVFRFPILGPFDLLIVGVAYGGRLQDCWE